MPRSITARLRTALAATAAVLLTTTALGAGPAQARVDETQRGPDPTPASVADPEGEFPVATSVVPRPAATGFGGGTVYYPDVTDAGTFGAVALSPGFTGLQSSVAWLGPRLASQGFVVFVIDTLTLTDRPASRGEQLAAALTYLTDVSEVRERVDPERLGVMGHSMGGGGALAAAKANPELKAAIPLTVWHDDTTWPYLTTPTLLIGAQADTVAPVALHSEPIYASLPDTTAKAYVELSGASHFAPNAPNTTIAQYSIAWLKRFLDDDRRYDGFLCPTPPVGGAISAVAATCPLD